VPPDQVFEDQRRFYRDNMRGEDLHISLRELDKTEREYRFLSRYLPTATDVGIGAISLFTGNPSYLLWLAVPEAWRMTEMGSGWLYSCYSRRLVSYMERLVEKNQAEIRKASMRHVDGEAQIAEAIDEVFKELDLDSKFPVKGLEGATDKVFEESSQEITDDQLIQDAEGAADLVEHDDDSEDDDFKQDGESFRPWDREDGDGWKNEYKKD